MGINIENTTGSIGWVSILKMLKLRWPAKQEDWRRSRKVKSLNKWMIMYLCSDLLKSKNLRRRNNMDSKTIRTRSRVKLLGKEDDSVCNIIAVLFSTVNVIYSCICESQTVDKYLENRVGGLLHATHLCNLKKNWGVNVKHRKPSTIVKKRRSDS